MSILSWLREFVADFFNATSGEDDARAKRSMTGRLREIVVDFFDTSVSEEDAEAERLRRELEEERALALMAVATAKRTELELRETVSGESSDGKRLAELVPRLEEERARADNLVAEYRRHEAEAEEWLTRSGKVRLADELNRRREELHEVVNTASRTGREEDLVRMEDEARAEAFRLDLTERLDAGEGWSRAPIETPGDESSLLARARELLEERSAGN